MHYTVKAESSMGSREQSTKPIMKLRLDGSLIMTLTEDESSKSITLEGLKLFSMYKYTANRKIESFLQFTKEFFPVFQ